MLPSRDDAWTLLNEYTSNESLIKHALSVEAAMRAYARKFGESEERWGIVGLLHDFDYERNPEPEHHPMVGARILEQEGYPDDITYAIKSHATYLNLPRNRLMDRTLFAVDELCGLITAATLVRPGRRVAELPVKSVKKKMKDKAFARSVNRDDIRLGVSELGVPLDEHIGNVIAAMATIAEVLGLDGPIDE